MSKSLKRALLLMLTALSCVIGGLVYSYQLAIENFEPVMQGDYYEKGLDYQSVLDASKRGQAFELKSEFLNQTNFAPGKQIFILRPRQKQTLSSAKLSITFEKQASIIGRQIIDLKLDQKTKSAFIFSADLSHLPEGQWEATIKAEINENARIVKRWPIFSPAVNNNKKKRG